MTISGKIIILLALAMFVATCSSQASPESFKPREEPSAKPFVLTGVSDLVGGGSESFYVSAHGDHLMDSSYCSKSPEETQERVNKYISNAISATEEKPGRYIIESADLPWKERFAIITADHGQCFRMMSASTLELLRDFERHKNY